MEDRSRNTNISVLEISKRKERENGGQEIIKEIREENLHERRKTLVIKCQDMRERERKSYT